jgi:putative ABC transport system ATP-binding protein
MYKSLPMNVPPRIEVRQLTLTRNDVPVLHQVDLFVAQGEIVCLLGPSGGGKSSLLRCINRLTEPPATSVFLNGTDATTLDILELRRQVGMVFQQVALFDGTVAENIAYGPGLQGLPPEPGEPRRLLELADLSQELADWDAGVLSGGQAQRVALARALATNPTTLLLDEPTSSLDPAATKNIEATVQKLRDTLGLTVLWVTHDPEQARRVADRLYLLVDGRILEEGAPHHVLKPGSEHLAALFAAGDLEGTT